MWSRERTQPEAGTVPFFGLWLTEHQFFNWLKACRIDLLNFKLVVVINGMKIVCLKECELVITM